MLEIDGSHDEGGGQILRTCLGLSAFTGKAFKIINIRSKRKNPGLKAQHLEAVNSVAKLCNAEVVGNKLHSQELTFKPGQIKSGRLNINIPTAGSCGLVLQALMIPAFLTTVKIKIEGGATYGKWAPPIDNQANILFPLLRKMGYDIELLNVKDGFYPKGGALVEVQIKKSELKPIELLEKGKLKVVKGISVASSNLEKANVAVRQAKAARKELSSIFDCPIKLEAFYRDSVCPGTGITLWVETENSVIGADSLGEQGKKSEQVGKEAAKTLIKEYSKGVVDSYTADQLLPYFAIAGFGKLKTSKITGHIRTNAFIIEKFLKVKFNINEEEAIVECKSY